MCYRKLVSNLKHMVTTMESVQIVRAVCLSDRPDIIPVNYPVLPSNWQSVSEPQSVGFKLTKVFVGQLQPIPFSIFGNIFEHAINKPKRDFMPTSRDPQRN